MTRWTARKERRAAQAEAARKAAIAAAQQPPVEKKERPAAKVEWIGLRDVRAKKRGRKRTAFGTHMRPRRAPAGEVVP
jgi:hypothetical protein